MLFLPTAIQEYLDNFLQEGIKAEREKYETELDGLRWEKDRLECQRKKLLEAHYNDATPIDLLKSKQQKIAKQLVAIDGQVTAHERVFTDIMGHLSDAIELIEDCGKTLPHGERPN